MAIIKSTIRTSKKHISAFFTSTLFKRYFHIKFKCYGPNLKRKKWEIKKFVNYGIRIVLVFASFSLQAQDKCKELFTPKAFAKAMTENLQLSPNQGDLFYLYRVTHFGDRIFVTHTFKEVTDTLQKHPDLFKAPMREQLIHFERRIYTAPDSLILFIKKFQTSYKKLKGNLFYIEENWVFWEKLFSISKKEKTEQAKQTFKEHLALFLDKNDRAFLANNSNSYKARALFLFKTLKKIREEQIKESKNIQKISQVMLDLIHTIGLGDPYIRTLISSRNSMEQLKGIHKALEKRNSIAQELGFKDFSELQKALEVPAPSGWRKNDNIDEILIHIEKEIKNSSHYVEDSQVFRVRALSLQESPFRGCLGGDCSTETYFLKALDPNFYYWTLTDHNYRSSGHITVVLGTAQNEKGKSLKIGFVDKIQGIRKEMILPMLESLRRSLSEKGYKLGLPQEVGNYSGLSNTNEVSEYIQKEVNPQLKRKLIEFRPHQSSYSFENGFSLAYDRPALYEFSDIMFDSSLKIKPGKIHPPQKADKNLNTRSIYNYVLSLRASDKEQYQIQFTKQLIPFVKLKAISFEEAKTYLKRKIENKSFSFSLRKLSFFTLIELYEFLEVKLSYKDIIYFLNQFSNKEQKNITGEMSNWREGNNINKKKFIIGLTIKRPEQEIMSILHSKALDPIVREPTAYMLIWAAKKGYKNVLEYLIEKKSMDLNKENGAGNTALMSAIWAKNEDSVKWLIEKGADIYKVNIYNDSALSVAIKSGHRPIMFLVLERTMLGQDFLNRNFIRNATHFATLEGHTDIAKFLKKILIPIRLQSKALRKELLQNLKNTANQINRS